MFKRSTEGAELGAPNRTRPIRTQAHFLRDGRGGTNRPRTLAQALPRQRDPVGHLPHGESTRQADVTGRRLPRRTPAARAGSYLQAHVPSRQSGGRMKTSFVICLQSPWHTRPWRLSRTHSRSLTPPPSRSTAGTDQTGLLSGLTQERAASWEPILRVPRLTRGHAGLPRPPDTLAYGPQEEAGPNPGGQQGSQDRMGPGTPGQPPGPTGLQRNAQTNTQGNTYGDRISNSEAVRSARL